MSPIPTFFFQGREQSQPPKASTAANGGKRRNKSDSAAMLDKRAALERIFSKIDLNGDGQLDREELKTILVAQTTQSKSRTNAGGLTQVVEEMEDDPHALTKHEYSLLKIQALETVSDDEVNGLMQVPWHRLASQLS